MNDDERDLTKRQHTHLGWYAMWPTWSSSLFKWCGPLGRCGLNSSISRNIQVCPYWSARHANYTRWFVAHVVCNIYIYGFVALPYCEAKITCLPFIHYIQLYPLWSVSHVGLESWLSYTWGGGGPGSSSVFNSPIKPTLKCTNVELWATPLYTHRNGMTHGLSSYDKAHSYTKYDM